MKKIDIGFIVSFACGMLASKLSAYLGYSIGVSLLFCMFYMVGLIAGGVLLNKENIK